MKENIKFFELNKIYQSQTLYDDYSVFDDDTQQVIKDLLKPIFEKHLERYRDQIGDHDWELWKTQEFHDMTNYIYDKVDRIVLWSWKTNATETVFTKRLSQWLHTNYSIKLNEDIKSEIGNVISRLTKLGTKYKSCYFDFDKEISWDQGDFGDNGSCFWTSSKRRDVKSFLRRDPRIYAVRFFKPHPILNPAAIKYLKVDNNHPLHTIDSKTYYMKGHARSWILLDKHEETPFSIVFNGYGLSLHDIANLMKIFIQKDQEEIKSKVIQLTDKGQTSGTLFVGNGSGDDFGGKGILIAPNKIISKIAIYDIGLDERPSIIEPEPLPSFSDLQGPIDKWNKENNTKAELLYADRDDQPEFTIPSLISPLRGGLGIPRFHYHT